MTLSRYSSRELIRARSSLHALLGLPDLAQTIKSLPVEAFSALVRSIGLEDAGEIVALATTDQLVQAFDEDLFVSEKSGERERFDVKRFALWLEVLLEAGEELTADRISELDESFVAHALSGLILVLEEDALRERLDESGERQGRLVDKAIENALLEEIDGYLLVAKQQQGWDSVLALVLALDRNHRPLLVRLLDRLVRIGSHLLDDLDELSTVLSEGESLAEDVEAAREERRSRQGYVEPRAARAFLLLARRPMDISALFFSWGLSAHASRVGFPAFGRSATVGAGNGCFFRERCLGPDGNGSIRAVASRIERHPGFGVFRTNG